MSKIIDGFADYLLEGVESLKHNCSNILNANYNRISESSNVIRDPIQNFFIPKATEEKIAQMVKKKRTLIKLLK